MPARPIQIQIDFYRRLFGLTGNVCLAHHDLFPFIRTQISQIRPEKYFPSIRILKIRVHLRPKNIKSSEFLRLSLPGFAFGFFLERQRPEGLNASSVAWNSWPVRPAMIDSLCAEIAYFFSRLLHIKFNILSGINQGGKGKRGGTRGRKAGATDKSLYLLSGRRFSQIRPEKYFPSIRIF
jgi:hypothetical protein